MSIKSFYEALYEYEKSTDIETIEALARCTLRNLTREELRAAIRVETYTHALDVGCGIGFNLTVLLMYANVTNVIGLDIAAGAIRIAKKRLLRRGIKARVDFIVGDAQALPLRESTFDLVVCTEVLEHIPDDVCGISEISRITRVHGKVFVSVPSARRTFKGYIAKEKRSRTTRATLRDRKFIRQGYIGLQTGGDLRSYEIEDLARLLKEKNIRVVRHWSNGRFFYSLSVRLNLVILSLVQKLLRARADLRGDFMHEAAGVMGSSWRLNRMLNLYSRTIIVLTNAILSLDLAVLRFDYGGNLTIDGQLYG